MAKVRAVVSMLSVLVVVVVGAVAAQPASGRVLPSNRVLYVIGDSWSAGLYADPTRALGQDAAADLGMSVVVDAESGTGYVNAPSGTSSYQQRATSLASAQQADLVVLQGGSNDVGVPAPVLRAAIAGTVAAVRAALPHSVVVLLGPGPDPWPVTRAQAVVDDALRQEASLLHVAYISPLREQWFTAANVTSIIDPTTAHPTVKGDEVIGQLLAADLRAHLEPHRRQHPSTRIRSPRSAGATRTG